MHWRPVLMSGLSLMIMTTTACGASSGENHATRQAQLERANRLATQIAQSLEITQQASAVQASATFQALQNVHSTAQEWPLSAEQSFDTNQGDWVTGEQSNEYGASSWRFEDGKYRWEVNGIQSLVWWSVPDMEPVSDFYLAASAAQVEGSSNTLLGLVFRKQEGTDYYVFQVSPLQQYAVYRNQGGTWQELIPWSGSTAIQPEGSNSLEIIAQGDHFLFFINGQYVTEMFDSSLAEGTVGLLVGLNNPGDHGVWQFDDYQFRLPPTASSSTTPTP